MVNHPANAERLRSERLDERSAFLVAYLIDGKPAFRPRTKPTVGEAIQTIHDAGGVAVWAHPFWDVKDPTPCSEPSTASVPGASTGCECFYATHTREQAELLDGIAALALGPADHGSSDFHGPTHRLFSRFRAFSTYRRTPAPGPDRRLRPPRR